MDATQVDASQLPRCEEMDGTTLHIVPSYTDAGYFMEANVVTISDGHRTAVYAPVRVIPADEIDRLPGRG